MDQYILSIDSGTTSNRAILFDREGMPAGISQKEFSQGFPAEGQVEHDPEEIWEVQLAVIRDLLATTGASPGRIAGIGIANQRETTVVWDRETGRPLYPAIVWQDRRTAEFCEKLAGDGLEGMIRDKTGLVIDAYFSASKIRWILENIEGARQRAEQGKLAFGTIDTWLLWNLTGRKQHITDVSNASRTMLFNIHTLEWDTELMEVFGIPEGMLPEVRSSSEIYGYTETGLFGREIPVSGMAGDQQAALFGQMCIEQGMAKNTYGTGCFVVMNTGRQAMVSEHKLLTTIAWKLGKELNYALEGSIFIAGAAVQWLRDKLKIISSAAEVEDLAATVGDSGGVTFVPAFVGLGAPHWDPYARGTITGIGRDTTDAHIARAALESIALQSLDVIRAMEKDSGIPLGELRVDGGAVRNDLLMQIQADVLGRKVIRPVVTETTALGAAYLAGLGTGFWSGTGEINKYRKVEKSFLPGLSEKQIRKMLAGWNRTLEKSRNWIIR